MNIYVYSDESGVFDHVHNDYFVFGGLILLGTASKDAWSRKYASIEKCIRQANNYDRYFEIKATTISNKNKGKIYRALNGCYKFSCIIQEDQVNSNIWNSKKDKQRYLDYAYKISVKRAFEHLINIGVVIPKEVDNLFFYVDEHTTATNGRYELRESLEREFKNGTYNYNYSKFFPPIFQDIKSVSLEFCDSSAPSKRLIRAADIVANKIFHLVESGKCDQLEKLTNMVVTKLP